MCYVEVLQANGKPVLQGKIGLNQGMGNGSFVLPASLASGNYLLRAYTAWMKNFDPQFYFEQPVSIVNTLKTAFAYEPASRSAYHLRFFPEGGNLVAGFANKLAFQLSDQFGSGADGRIDIRDDNNLLVSLRPQHAGMGSFQFTPIAGKKYRATVTLPDTSFVQELPAVYAKGYTLGLQDSTGGPLKLIIQASENGPAYLLVHTRHVLKQVQVVPVQNGRAEIMFDKKGLNDGISQFTLFNASRQPVCERLYCKRPTKKLSIMAKPDQPAYATRSNATIEVQTGTGGSESIAADLSLSVFLVDSLQPPRYLDILSYLLLQSDLPGPVESPAFYFEESNQAAHALDNLMLTQGWRRFRWEEVLNEPPAFEFLAETEGPLVNGKVINKTGAALPNIAVTASVPGTDFSYGTAVSQENGLIRFNMRPFYGGSSIIVQTEQAADSSAQVEISNPFSVQYSGRPLPRFQLPEAWKEQLLTRSINLQAENSYLTEKKQQAFSRILADTTQFYGKPDYHYHLDDYTRFITMEEVMQEFVMPVRVHREGGKLQLRVYNSTTQNFFEEPALVLLDGVPVADPGKIMQLDPLKLRDIDVLSHRYHLGRSVGAGVVSYRSNGGDLAGYPLDPGAIVVAYEGLQHQREFYMPLYETATKVKSRLPDLRNQLCWLPQLHTGPDGKTEVHFTTSDTKGNFLIVVQGIGTDGLAGSTMVPFAVH